MGCSLGDFFTDVLYVAVHPYASVQLWVAACTVLVLPALVFSLGSGLLFQVIGRGIPRMIVAATRFGPKEVRALKKGGVSCLVRGACLPVSTVAAVLFLVLIKPVLCLVLLFLAVNLKLVVFTRLMSRLIDFVLHELPEEEASVQTAPFGISPNSNSQVKHISSTSSSMDETEDVFRLNLAFLSAMVFGTMPQLGITISNTYYLGQSSAASGYPEAASGPPVLALVSMFFSVLVIFLHGGRMVYWRNRYGWRMDLRMIMYPLKDTHLQRLQLIRNLYKASHSIVSTPWAPDTGREKRTSAAAERTPWATRASASSNGSIAEPSSSSGPRTYMAAVTTRHETTKPGWLSLDVGQVVNVLFENPSADEVFVKVLVDGRQGSFPMRCVTLNDDKGMEYRKAESKAERIRSKSKMPVGLPPEEVRTDAYYAQRRAPTVPQLYDCLRRYALLLAIETDGHFDAVAKLLERRFPYATAKFVCNERKNVSPRAQKAQLRANQSSEAFADAMARMNAVDLALWRHVRDHPAVRV